MTHYTYEPNHYKTLESGREVLLGPDDPLPPHSWELLCMVQWCARRAALTGTAERCLSHHRSPTNGL